MIFLRKRKQSNKLINNILFFALSSGILYVLHTVYFPGTFYISNKNIYYISETKNTHKNTYVMLKIDGKKSIFLVKNTFGDKYCAKYFNHETKKIEKTKIDNQCLRIPIDHIVVQNKNYQQPILIHKRHIIRKMQYLGDISGIYNKIWKENIQSR